MAGFYTLRALLARMPKLGAGSRHEVVGTWKANGEKAARAYVNKSRKAKRQLVGRREKLEGRPVSKADARRRMECARGRIIWERTRPAYTEPEPSLFDRCQGLTERSMIGATYHQPEAIALPERPAVYCPKARKHDELELAVMDWEARQAVLKASE